MKKDSTVTEDEMASLEKDVQKYRAAEAKQNNVPDETSEDKEKKEKETKTASVKEVVNGLLSKYINK